MRKKNIQIMRGLAVLLVVFQHALIAVFGTGGGKIPLITSICFSIDVNVFMFISGYLFEENLDRYQKEGGKIFVKSKAASLLVPYFFWECLLYIPTWIVYHGPASLSRLGVKLNNLGFVKLSIWEILKSLVTFNNSYVELYWFIYVLFIIFVLEYFIGKRLLGIRAIWLIAVLPILLYVSNMAYVVKKLCVSLIIFKMGREIKKREIPIEQWKPWAALIGIAIFGIVFKTPDVHDSPYIEQLQYVVKSAILGLCGVVIIAVIANCVVESNSKVTLLVELIGNYSFSIYIMHNPYVVKVVSMLFPNNTGFYRLVSFVVCMSLGVLVPYLADRYFISRVRKGTQIIGKLELQGHGTVEIGENVKIYSTWRKNPVGGGTGRTVLQTIGDGKIIIGDNTGISHATFVSRLGIELGNNVLVGGGVQIFDNDFHPVDYRERQKNENIKKSPVIVEDNVFIGANSIILKGVRIGEGAVIGAGSVVTKSVPANEVWAGNPARYVKKIE